MSWTLLTGATGLLGQYLMRDLVLRGHKIAVLARPSKRESAEQRIERLMQHWDQCLGRPLPRPVVLSGNVNETQLGLQPKQLDWVSDHCDTLLHSAASLQFHGSDRQEEPWLTNFQGTKNVLNCCSGLGIRDLHYVSTAYVCGWRKGRILEDELEHSCGFRNDYELSKNEAEQYVRGLTDFDCTTIYRPAVIAGDSKTGYTSTYHGLYFYLKLMSVLVWNKEPDSDGVRTTPVRLRMTGDEARNIIPVDWASEAMVRLFETPEAHGQTFHLAPKEPVTPRQLIEAGYRYFNSRGVEFVGPDQDPSDSTPSESDSASISEIDESAHSSMVLYSTYETTDPTFDTTRLRKYCSDLPCPTIDEAMLHRFWDYGEKDRWGKRRMPVVQVDRWSEEIVEALVCKMNSLSMICRSPLCLNIVGAGGGYWILRLNSDGRWVSNPGSVNDAQACWTGTVETLSQLVDNLELASDTASASRDDPALSAADWLQSFAVG